MTLNINNKTYLLKRYTIATIIVFILGITDYITGEISLDVLYILCICLTTWYTSTTIGLLIVVEILLAKTTADYFDHIKIGSHLYGLNAIIYLMIYFVVCISVSKLKSLMSK
jgi:hypothetical protein